MSLGPWFWPAPVDEEAVQIADKVMGTDSGLEGGLDSSGRMPIVAYHSLHGGSLWLFDLSYTRQHEDTHEFLEEAQQGWRDVVSAVPRSIPVLWKPLRGEEQKKLRARRAAGCRRASVLDGRSFGLSFALALVSRLLEVPVPVEFMASAGVDESGRILPVDGLEQKLDATWQYAPKVKRFLVASDQRQEAERHAGPGLDVIGVQNLTEAVDTVFDELPRRLVEVGDSRKSRRELVEEIFRLCLCRRDSIVDWSPVGRAAKLAGERWKDLSDGERRKLEIAEAVARRHQGNSGAIELPPRKWIEQIPQPHRTDVVANIVQQSHDTGEPDPSQVLDFAEHYVVRGADAFGAHIKLLGALGRLRYLVGDLEGSLRMQKEAIQGWFQRWREEEISYPLSFAYHVVGALGEVAEFETVLELEERWRSLCSAEPPGSEYVHLARGRAETLFGDLEEAAHSLERADAFSRVSDPFRRQVDRWRIFVLEEKTASGGDQAEEAKLRKELLERHSWNDNTDCPETFWLSMTRALRDGDREQAIEDAIGFEDTAGFVAKCLREAADCSKEELPELFFERYPY